MYTHTIVDNIGILFQIKATVLYCTADDILLEETVRQCVIQEVQALSGMYMVSRLPIDGPGNQHHNPAYYSCSPAGYRCRYCGELEESAW